MADLSGILDAVAGELRDAAHATWSAEELTAQVRRALRRYNGHLPRRLAGTLNAVEGQREYSLDGLSGLLDVLDVWYPWSADDEDPPERPRWALPSDGTLYLYVESAPAAGEVIRVFYTAPHTIEGLDGALATTLPAQGEQAVIVLAAGYAAIQRGGSLIGTVTPSQWTPVQWQQWGEATLARAMARVAQIERQQVIALDPRVTWAASGRREGRGGVV
jgi:hypothetical protein